MIGVLKKGNSIVFDLKNHKIIKREKVDNTLYEIIVA
jgi:hypothetical protein